MIRAPHLQPGDTIAIISPSWGGPAFFPHRADAGERTLAELGYRVIFGKHARNTRGYVADTAENRAADLHALFADPQVKAIISSIGGDHSNQLLPLLNFDLIRANPKILMGFSDVTVLNIAIQQATGLVTFNGPALLTDFAEYPRMFNYTLEAFNRTLTQPAAPGQILPAARWTEEFMDWETKADQTRPRETLPSTGWTWLKPGAAEGPLLGGCLESLDHLRGTRFWPDWQGAFFFWETSEEKPSPAKVDAILMDYENMGVFERLNGMLVGRPMSYSVTEKQELREVILERTRAYSFPVITDMDFGHTAPQFILPLGCRARMNSDRQEFSIVEAAVT